MAAPTSPPVFPAWRGPFDEAGLVSPGEVGICRHWYVADEVNLDRDGGGHVTTIANLGSEGDAVGLASSQTFKGRQGLHFENAADAMISSLGFTGTDLTIFAAAMGSFGAVMASVADRDPVTYGPGFYGPNTSFYEQANSGSTVVSASGEFNPFGFGNYGIISFPEINPVMRVVGMRVSFADNTPILEPVYGYGGLVSSGSINTTPVPGPFTAAHTVTLGHGTNIDVAYLLRGHLRGISIHEGLLTDEEMVAIGLYWEQQLRGTAIQPPLVFSQVADYLESPPPALTHVNYAVVSQPSSQLYGFSANKRFQVDGKDFMYSGGDQPANRADGDIPSAQVTALAVGGIILPLDAVQGIYTVGAVTVRLTADWRIRVETEHNAAQSEPLTTGVPHSFLVQVDFNGTDADTHIPTLIIDGVSDKTLDGVGFGARTVAYAAPLIDAPANAAGCIIFNKLFSIYDLLGGDQITRVVDFLESDRTTGGVLSQTYPLVGLQHFWSIGTRGDLSVPGLTPLELRQYWYPLGAMTFSDHNNPYGRSTFCSPGAYLMGPTWFGSSPIEPPSPDEDEVLHNGGPATLYVAGYFPPVRGMTSTSAILSTTSAPGGGSRGFFFGYYAGQLYFAIGNAGGLAMAASFDFEGVGGVVVKIDYGGSPEYLIETIDVDGSQTVVASGSFTTAPEAGPTLLPLTIFGSTSNPSDRIQAEVAAIGYWVGLVDTSMIADEQVRQFADTDDFATIGARKLSHWPRVQIAVKYDQRSFLISGVNARIRYWFGTNYDGVDSLNTSYGSSGAAEVTFNTATPFIKRSFLHPLYVFFRLAPRLTIAFVGKANAPLDTTPVLSNGLAYPYVFAVVFHNEVLRINIGDATGSLSMKYDDGLADNTIVKSYILELDFNASGVDIIRAVYIDGILIPGVVFSATGTPPKLPETANSNPELAVQYRCFSVHNTIYPESLRLALYDFLETQKVVDTTTYPENFNLAEDCYLLDNVSAEIDGGPPEVYRWRNRVKYRPADAANNSLRANHLVPTTFTFAGIFANRNTQDKIVVFLEPAAQTTTNDFSGGGAKTGGIAEYTVSFVAKSPASGEVVVLSRTGVEPLTLYIDDTGVRVIASTGGNTVEVRVNGVAADTMHSYLIELDYTAVDATVIKSIVVDAVELTRVVLQNDAVAFSGTHTYQVGSAGLQLRGLATHRTHFATEFRDALIGFWENHKL